MWSVKLAAVFVAFGAAACQIVPDVRDTTQPDKVAKSSLRCGNSQEEWSECRAKAPAEWYFRPTVIDAPYEAWWTFVGEQGDTYKIVWEITETSLVAYRRNEAFKGSDLDKVKDPNYRAEPIAAWPITSHFDVWYQYNPATGEKLPVLYEAQERPWYEREFIRVHWGDNQIAGYGFFMGSKLTAVLDPQALVTEPAHYAVNDPADPDYRILTDDYVDVVTREVHTPMTVSGMDGKYFSTQPTSEVAYRYSFMLAEKRDYDTFYYPDAAFEKFGFFRHEREVYDPKRGATDFKDYLMNRWNLWSRVHDDAKACDQHSDCGGGAETGVTCDLFNKESNADGRGRCTLPYAARGVKPVTYYLSADFPGKYLTESCMVAQGWNVAYKQVLAKLLNKAYTPPTLDDQFAAGCRIEDFKAPPEGVEFDPAVHDVFVLKQNSKSCNSDGIPVEGGDRWCARLGDLRHSMLYYVDQPSAGSPLGYGPVASDPITGEIIQGNSFIYGGALESYSSYIGDVVDLIRGDLTDEQIRAGENVREYYQNLSGNVFPPTVPQDGFRIADMEMLEGLKNGDWNASGSKERLEELKKLSPEGRQPFAFKLRGTWIERLLVDHEEWKLAHGIDATHSLTEEELDVLSPFRPGWREGVRREQKMEGLLSHSKNCVYRANEYTDATVTWLVERYEQEGLGRDEIIARLMGQVYRGVTEHEIGHNMGLRHNFEGSFDRDNYFEPYYELLDRPGLEAPDPLTFSAKTPKSLPLTPDEFTAFDQARTASRLARDRQGVKLYQYSSIMEYGGQFYADFRGLGRYDLAALKFGYGRLVEVFDGAPNQTRSNRLDRTWYLGGELCETNAECPYAGAGQTCVPSVRNPAKKACTSHDQDAARDADRPPVKYRFCSDERVTDRPFCNRFDEGSSSLEIVENLIESYDRNYIFNNFRRYRRFFGNSYASRIWSRYYEMMGKQFASLLYQLYYNQSSVLSSGGGSFSDMLAASVKAMNFFTRVLTTPDVGSYRAEPLEQLPNGDQRYRYVRYSRDCKDATSAEFAACLGVGKHFYSVWETGYYGALERQSRAGTYVDKQLAIYALTNRDWGNPQANDETYPLSYYDGFQGEMLKLFSGLISADIRQYAPVIRKDLATNEAKLVYRDVWSGTFFGTAAKNFDYNTTPIVEYPGSSDNDHRYDGESILDPEGSSPFIRFLALVYSLQGWQNIFDQTYADYLQIYTFGGPEVRFPADCTPTSTTCQTVAYESPIRKKTYMAVQTPDRKSIIFPLVKQAVDLKTRYDEFKSMTPEQAVEKQVRANHPDECRFNTTPDDFTCRTRLLEQLESELTNRESFLNVTAEVTRLLGLNL